MFKTNQIVYLVNSSYSDPAMCRVFASNEYESVLRVITYESGEEEPIEMLSGLLVRSNSQIFESEIEANKQIIWRQEQAKNYSEIESQEKRIKELKIIITDLEKKGKEIDENNKKATFWATPKFKPNDSLYFFDPEYTEKEAYSENYRLDIPLSRYHRYTFDHYKLVGTILTTISIKYRFLKLDSSVGFEKGEYVDIDEKYCFLDRTERDEALLEFVKDCQVQKEDRKKAEIERISKEIDTLQAKIVKLSEKTNPNLVKFIN